MVRGSASFWHRPPCRFRSGFRTAPNVLNGGIQYQRCDSVCANTWECGILVASAFSAWPGGCHLQQRRGPAFNRHLGRLQPAFGGLFPKRNPPLLNQREMIEIDAQPSDCIATAPPLSRRLLCAGWFLCLLRPRVLERDRPVENEVFRRTVFV